MVKTPNVLILKPIAPSAESSHEEVLKYTKIDEYNDKNAPYEYARINEVWDTPEGSLEEDAAVRQLANHYLVATAAMVNTVQKPESIKTWSNRYTKASRELHGEPEEDYAKKLVVAQATSILEESNGRLADEYRKLLKSFSIETSDSKPEREFEHAAAEVEKYLIHEYGSVFAALTEGLNDDEAVSAEEIYKRFSHGLDELRKIDDGWNEWTVVRNDERDQLSVAAGEKKISVGMRRAPISGKKLRGLFSHEVLVHALRGKNGGKVSQELATGLPGYLDAEEGLGVFFEYATTGEVPEKNLDRYTDIALALGQIDGRMHSRKELLEYAMVRERLRNEKRTKDKKTDEAIKADVYAHANRIFRGTRGDKYIGVFTKDVSYHKGFMLQGQYIESRLNDGESIGEIMEFLLQGKFDPTNERHLAVVT